MPDIEFNTTAGQTIARELMILYLNTGTSEAPVWSAVGSRVGESDVEYDWGQESSQDILGKTNTSMKKPVITQSFDPLPLDAGDAAAVMLWNIAVKDQDAQKLSNLDMLVAHFYAKSGASNWAERYASCAAPVTRLGGEGGGNLTIGSEVTFGGTRTLGTVKKTGETVTFTEDTAA